MSEHRQIGWRQAEPDSEARLDQGRRRPPLGLERWVLRRLLSALAEPPLRFSLWDGSTVSGAARSWSWTLSIGDRSTLWRFLVRPQFQFGEAYSAGRLEVEGDLVSLLEWVGRSLAGAKRLSLLERLPRRTRRRNSLRRSRQNIHHHYDLGNDFYRLWLDEELLYTCAYYPTPDATLEQAQRAKMEHVCRKLRLQPGERVVEAGSGWGALALYMAREYGVSVTSYNISRQQVEYARNRLRREGSAGAPGRQPLAGRVEFVEADYRRIEGDYDAFVSVGMLEHVGPRHYDELGEVMDRVLGSDGRALIHTIGRNRRRPLNPWIERRIFPGACPPTLGEMMPLFEPHDFAVVDVESLRLHYAQTLRHWLERYEASIGAVRELFDERFERAWRLYLSGSIAAFQAGTLQLFQVLVHRASSNRVAMTRDHLAQSGEAGAPGERAAPGELVGWKAATR